MSRVVASVVVALFLTLVSRPGIAQAQGRAITLAMPAQFSISFPAVSPSACWRVVQPADGRITATVTGKGDWNVCVADTACPTDCMDNGLRSVTTERVRAGRYYFVRVETRSPDVAATLAIFATGGGAPVGPPPGGAGIVGKWTYRSGTFTDVHIYHADGSISAPGSPEASATWAVEGGEVVSRWHNKWSNRLALPVTNGSISGVSVDPAGHRSPISLTRIGDAPAASAPPPAPAPTSPLNAGAMAGKWEYRSGGFTDVHIYHADGTVTAPGSPEASAHWSIQGGEVVSSWHNKWQNRLKLPVANGRISGVSVDPSGVRTPITLRRIE